MIEAARIARELQARWATTFGRRDWKLLATLYTDEAQLFGGKPQLFTSRESVLRYFEAMPPDVVLTAEFGEQHVVQIAPDVIVSAGDVAFRRAGASTDARAHRITLVLAKRNDEWLIASHHASAKQ